MREYKTDIGCGEYLGLQEKTELKPYTESMD
jgi:hypothetical protein